MITLGFIEGIFRAIDSFFKFLATPQGQEVAKRWLENDVAFHEFLKEARQALITSWGQLTKEGK